MAENSGISWTDHTFNPWMGCTKVSPACKHCYAERDFDHRFKKVQWGPNGTRVVTSDAYWKKPLHWNAQAKESGKRPRVFCASLADVFEDWQDAMLGSDGRWVGCCGKCGKWESMRAHSTCCKVTQSDLGMDEVRKRLFDLIDATPNLDWLLLTKRPKNILRMWPTHYVPHPMPQSNRGPLERMKTRFRANVCLGTSVENQKYADERIPELLKCRDLSPVLFLSCEPLLGPVNLHPWLCKHGSAKFPDEKLSSICDASDQINWVIAGGESGPEARPSHPDWFRSLRDQCHAANVPFHFKQWGEWTYEDHPAITLAMDHQKVLPFVPDDLCPMYRFGTKLSGRVLDGREWNEFPVAK